MDSMTTRREYSRRVSDQTLIANCAGAQTKIVSLKPGKIQGMNHADKGDKFDVDLAVKDARPDEFDALMIPGGLFNPDVLRSDQNALGFAQHFFREHKPVAVICHGP